jgi:hypothetical protein
MYQPGDFLVVQKQDDQYAWVAFRITSIDTSGAYVIVHCPDGAYQYNTYPDGDVWLYTVPGHVADDWAAITGKPSTFPPTLPIPWTDVSGKPSTFPPTLPIAQADVTNLTTDLAAKASLASPTFTGNPQGPTPSPGDNDTSIATTGFVFAAIAAALATIIGGAVISDTAPSHSQGKLWWDSSTGNLYISYDDGTSTQWVQVNVTGSV